MGTLPVSCSVKEIDMLSRALNVFCLHTIKLFYPNDKEIRDILLLIVQISFKAIPSCQLSVNSTRNTCMQQPLAILSKAYVS